jgi:tRNA (guanine-N7-)-methyltransferase
MGASLSRLRVDLAGDAPIDPRGLFASAPSRVVLEIGFGGGEHLVAGAASHSGTGFIGCEPFINGVAKLMAAIEAGGLANVRIHDGDAVALMRRLPTGSLARVDLLYADPWPKRRHHKRRFVSDERIAEIARVLEPGGEFRFATDIDDYAAWTLARMARSPDFTWAAKRADDWRRPWEGWPGTRYERKAIREGRPPAYLTFIRR